MTGMKSKEVNTSPQKGIVLAGESKLYMVLMFAGKE